MFQYGIPKVAAHADDRLAERTNLDPQVLKSLRKDIKRAAIPYGTHHVALEDGSFAVLKDVSRAGRKRHVVATVLSPEMSPPGSDITSEFESSGNGQNVYVSNVVGPNIREDKGRYTKQKPNEFIRKYGKSRDSRFRNALKSTRVAEDERFKKYPDGFSSSTSYSYSSQEKAASVIGAAAGGYYAGGDAKNRAKGALLGGLYGQAVGWAGTGLGLYGAHKLGYTNHITKGRTALEATDYIARNPMKSLKSIGAKGNALIVGGSVLGSALGGVAGARRFRKNKKVKKK